MRKKAIIVTAGLFILSSTFGNVTISAETLTSNETKTSSVFPNDENTNLIENKTSTNSETATKPLGDVSPELAQMTNTENNSTENTGNTEPSDGVLLMGANPDDGTSGLQYNSDFTEVTGYSGTETDIIIPNGVISIDANAFSDTRISSVNIPNSVTTVGYYAFSNNLLSSVNIPDSVTTIDEGAFYNNLLSSVNIPDSVTTIGELSFSFNQLTSITIPDSVTTIAGAAFSNNLLSSVTIPDSVTTIEVHSFSYNQLSSVTIPDSVTAINDSAFYKNQLSSVSIPDFVTTIGAFSFSDNQLSSVSIPDSVTTIGDYAFYKNQLPSVTIPDTVTTIGTQIIGFQTAVVNKVRQSSYQADNLGISTHYLEDKTISLISQTDGVSSDGNSVHLDPNFTGNQFLVSWTSWDGQHFGDLTVNLVDKVPGTINYLESKTGQQLLSSKNVSSQVGGTFNWTAPEEIENYKVDYSKSTLIYKSGEQTQSIVLSELMTDQGITNNESLISYLNSQIIADTISSAEINYVYTKAPVAGGSVTVHYIDTDGNTISNNVIKSGNVGATYSTEQKNISGYTFKEVKGNVSGTFTTDPQEVTYIYNKDPIAGGSVTAKYVDTDGNTISDNVIKSGNIGETYSTEQKDISGYTFKEVKGNASGTFTTDPQTVTYVYTKNPVVAGNVTIKYVDTQGKSLASDLVKSGKIGDSYTSEQKKILGYTFKEVQGNASGSFTDQAQTVTYVYTKNPASRSSVTVHYVDTDKNTISNNVIKSGNVGETYTSEQKNISGYTFKEVKGNASGTFSTDPQEVTYVYTKDPVTPPISQPNSLKPSSSIRETRISSASSISVFDTNVSLPTTGDKRIDGILYSLGGGMILFGLCAFLFNRYKKEK